MLTPVFLKSHPKAGEPTGFFQKVWNHVGGPSHEHIYAISETFTRELNEYYRRDEYGVKTTTIRKGERWEVGDVFQFRAWAGAPYRSKHVILTVPLVVTKVEHFEVMPFNVFLQYQHALSEKEETEVAEKDGLSIEDFRAWFPVEFEGQRIHFTQHRP